MADVFDFYVQDDRKISFEIAEPIMLEDNHVTDWVFHIPKSLNGFDMSAWAWWLVYVNARNEKFSERLVLSDDPERPTEYSIATYSVDYGMSIKAGNISFAVEAINADTGGTVTNEWHTFTYQTTVKNTLQGNQAEFARSESDIISALIASFLHITVGTDQIENGAVTTDKIADGAVTSAKFSDLSIGTSNLENEAVTGEKLADNSVTSGKIFSNSVTASKLANGAVTTAKLASGAVTELKLADALKLKVIKDYVTPEMYGAKGDGTTDDLSAFQSAITAMSAGDVLYVPAKTYLLSGTFTINKAITVIGDGKLYVTHANPVLVLDAVNNAVVDLAKIEKSARAFDYIEGASTYSIAVTLRNCGGCNVNIHSVLNTTTAFLLLADGTGCHYNQIQCDDAHTFTGIEIVRTSNGGWVNGNRVNAFRWMVNTWFDNVNLVAGYMVKSLSNAKNTETEPYKNNANYFDHLVVEYGAKQADYPILLCRLDYARGYTLNFDRVEISPKTASLTDDTFYFTNSAYCVAFIWFSVYSIKSNIGSLGTDHNLIVKKADFEAVSFSGIRSILSNVTLHSDFSYTSNWFQVVKNASTKSVRILGELIANDDIPNLTHIFDDLPTCRQGWGTMILTPSITETQWQAAGTVTHYKLSITSGRTFLVNVGAIPSGTHLFMDFEYLIAEDDL